MTLQEKEEWKDEKDIGKLFRKKPVFNSRLKLLRSYFKGRHSAGKKSSVMLIENKIVNVDILITSRNDDRKITQPTRITFGPPRESGSRTSLASSDENLPN